MEIRKNKIRRKIVKKNSEEDILKNLKGEKRNFDFIKEWEKIGKKISKEWDSISLGDELKYQRNKNS